MKYLTINALMMGIVLMIFKISEEEFISLDSLLKESAMKEGFFIDDSIYQDVIGAFPFSLTFVVRK